LSDPKTTKSEYIKSALAIAVIIVVVLGFFFGLRFALNTDTPVRVVESGSMCVEYDGACDGWSHIFDPTLHVGDVIIIQGIDPNTINADYPNSDIIVYMRPDNPSATPVVHRVVAKYEVNGTLYFQTKGDGNGDAYPNVPSSSEYDSNTLWHTGEGVPADMVLGKVVMRIPLFGHITLFLRENSWGLPLVIGLIFVLLIVEFIIPIIKSKSPKPTQETSNGENVETQKFTLQNGYQTSSLWWISCYGGILSLPSSSIAQNGL
jgi:signal peptidase